MQLAAMFGAVVGVAFTIYLTLGGRGVCQVKDMVARNFFYASGSRPY